MLDQVKDHLIPRIVDKKIAKDIYDTLETLYQSVNIYKKMPLRNTLTTTRMGQTYIVESYLMKIVKLRDQTITTGNTVKENEPVQISLNGFSPLWHNFFQVI